VREIEFEKIVEAVESLCISAAYELPEDVAGALERAAATESSASAVGIIREIIENAKIASTERIPLCQDTGLSVVFVEQGADVVISGGTISEAINKGVAAGYEKGYLRKSVVAEPMKSRVNTGTNTPAIIHYSVVGGDELKITLMAKGGGCENKSAFRMFKPTAEKEEIVDWIVGVVASAGADACPPFVVGVGIGGDFELSCLLSKKALLRKIGSSNSDKFYADLEAELLSRINSLGIGPGGFGGDTTALGCMVETAASHIASLAVAVNMECHSHRHKSVTL